VGLGVDFAIQFAVRYRSERHDKPELRSALESGGGKIGVPLTLRRQRSSRISRSFRLIIGASRNAEIAGVGMLIAYVTSITLLPALITVLNPQGEPEPIGYSALAPIDWFLQNTAFRSLRGRWRSPLWGRRCSIS
jgi:hypothetical protein